MRRVAIVGAGPAGLMAAERLVAVDGQKVLIFDAMPSPGRKFLMAGKGGMNITHAEPLADFVGRYGSRQAVIAPLLERFGPQQLREWIHGLGIATFVGTSGRVFPTGMKAAPLLRAWLHRLRQRGVQFHVRHRWLGWADDGALRFATPDGERRIAADASILALGGGSWAKLGSDGAWVPLLLERGIPGGAAQVRPTAASTSPGARISASASPASRSSRWSRRSAGSAPAGRIQHHRRRHRGRAGLRLVGPPARRAGTRRHAPRCISTWRPARRWNAWCRPRPAARARFAGQPPAPARRHRRRQGRLLRELPAREDVDRSDRLAAAIKALPLPVTAPRPLDEAISTAGGVAFEALDENLMLRDLPGVFCAGEMLDWEAPTGGYLLTACFATGRAAGEGCASLADKSRLITHFRAGNTGT
jgi:predicted flavoprotein YhiN